jgi:AraC family transcriptional regulator
MSSDATTPSSHIATRDPTTGDAIRVAEADTTVWSSAARWSGVVVELHRYERLDTPEFYVPDHLIALHRPATPRIDIVCGGSLRTHTVQRGSITLIPAGIPRRLRQGPSEMLVVALTPMLVEQSAGGTRPVQLEERHVVDDQQIVRIAKALEAEAQAGYPSGHLYGDSMGIALAAHLTSRYARDDGQQESGGGLTACRLRRVLHFIDDNLADDVRLDVLADIAGLSQHRFAHNFKRAVGLPPHQFVIRRRLALAKPMLRDTNDTIASVTYALGFGSPSRFTYLFRRETGVTPSRYRASFR